MSYIYLNGSRRGPFSEEQVRTFLRDGLVTASDLGSTEVDGELKPIGSFEVSQPAATPAAEPRLAVTQESLPAFPLHSLGPYARATLAPNETPVYKTSLHWIVFVRFAVLALVAFLLIAIPFAIGVQALFGSQIGWFALPLPVLMMIPPTLAYVSSELVITDSRVLIKTGVLRRETLEMFISKIESIAIDQSFLARLLGYGTVTIRGTGGREEPFATIAAPIEFRNWVQRVQERNETTR